MGYYGKKKKHLVVHNFFDFKREYDNRIYQKIIDFSTFYPFELCFFIKNSHRYPGGGMTKYLWLHKFRSFLFHWIPAIFIDMLLFCLGFKPM